MSLNFRWRTVFLVCAALGAAVAALWLGCNGAKRGDWFVAVAAATAGNQAFSATHISASGSVQMIAVQGGKDPVCVAVVKTATGHDCSDSFFITFSCTCDSSSCKCQSEYVYTKTYVADRT